MRGEDSDGLCSVSRVGGSPPHARGRRMLFSILALVSGITPACAGKTDDSVCGHSLPADHPRMRGEDSHSFVPDPSFPGSPPHARGRPNSKYDIYNLLGITPACAGKTCRPFLKNFLMHGSPPHARGRHVSGHAVCRPLGITPACAGKTLARRACTSRMVDHPRMRGEDS